MVVVVATAGAGAGAASAAGAGATVVVVVVDVVGGLVDVVVEEVGASVLGRLEVAWNRAYIDAEVERGPGAGVRPKSTTATTMSAELATRKIGNSPAARARRAGGKGMGEGSRVRGVQEVADSYPVPFQTIMKLQRKSK